MREIKTRLRSFLAVSVGILLALGSLVPGAATRTAMAAGIGFNPPQIAIVFPHQSNSGLLAPVAQAPLVNVSAWPTGPLSCTPQIPANGLVLGEAHNNDPVVPLSISPGITYRTVDGVRFPSLEFNDVPANLAAGPTGKYSFVVVGGVLSGSNSQTGNVWVHAADPRTYYPKQLRPTGFTTQANPPVDLRIQVVWPHDAQGRLQPVSKAPLVNIAVDIFEHGTTLSVHPDFLQTVPSRYPVSLGLQIARGNEALAGYSGKPQQISYTVDGQSYPRWVFNDVPVDPTQQYHFMAILNGVLGGVTDGRQFSNVWTHAADARTYLPNPTVPPACSS